MKTNQNTATGISVGMCIGIGIGTALGSAGGSISSRMPIGLALGMALGMLLGAIKDKRINDQLKNHAWKISQISSGDPVEVTIEDKTHNSKTVWLSRKDLNTLKFEKDEYIYLNGEHIEKVQLNPEKE